MTVLHIGVTVGFDNPTEIHSFKVDTSGEPAGADADYTLCGDAAAQLMGIDISKKILKYALLSSEFAFYASHNALEYLVKKHKGFLLGSEKTTGFNMALAGGVYNALLSVMNERADEANENFDDDVTFDILLHFLEDRRPWVTDGVTMDVIEKCILNVLKEVATGDHDV